MIRFLVYVVVLCAGLFYGHTLVGSKGYVLIATQTHTIETSIPVAIISIIVFFILFQLVERLFFMLLRLNSATRRWVNQRGKKRAEALIERGMVAMLEHDFIDAERLLVKGTKRSAAPMLGYLAAAKVSQVLHHQEQRDHYLLQAKNCGDNPIAVLFTQAQLQLEQKQYQQAEETLTQLSALKGNRFAIMTMQYELYSATAQWQKLLTLLPEAKKAGVINDTQYQCDITRCYQGRFDTLAAQDDPHSLAVLWSSVPRKHKKSEGVLVAIIGAFIAAGDSESAYQIVGEQLSKGPKAPYTELLPRLLLDDYGPIIDKIKSWIKRYPDTPGLQHLLAQLLIKDHQWLAAKKALILALKEQDSRLNHLLMAKTLQQLGEPKQALYHYNAVETE